MRLIAPQLLALVGPHAVPMRSAVAPRASAGADIAANPSLLIVGAGVLGQLVGQRWRDERGDALGRVLGVTRRADAERDAGMRACGIEPILRSGLGAAGCHPYVVFCAAPGGNDEYAAEVKAALELWDSTAAGGARFVFTSSAGVYAEQDGGIVTEGSPTAPPTPRTQKLLDAEAAVRDAGGSVVRLAGLYLLKRGAHNAWLSMGEVSGPADGLINQIHYADAAGAVVAALLRGEPGEVYIGADGAPLSREAICREALRAPQFGDAAMPTFGGGQPKFGGTGRGKVLDASATRDALGWAPRYGTFGDFIDEVVAEAEGEAAPSR